MHKHNIFMKQNVFLVQTESADIGMIVGIVVAVVVVLLIAIVVAIIAVKKRRKQ